MPTGLGAAIGGHAGDATPALRLVASISDVVFSHPNVVNASDLNEQPENMWYVEGSMLDRFLEGEIGLEKFASNKILVVVNKLENETINAIGAARAVLGIEAEILVLKDPLKMKVEFFEDGRAGGIVNRAADCIRQINESGLEYDAIALHTPIDFPTEDAIKYFREGGVNPWGGVEAIASHIISAALEVPVAHAPTENPEMKTFNEVVDPAMAAELVSTAYIHCVLKGLHTAPRYSETQRGQMRVTDINAMVSPDGCWGRPHEACTKANIPIIIVKENSTIEAKWIIDIVKNREGTLIKGNNLIYVTNYTEAVGVLVALREGISLASLQRPLYLTKIHSVLNTEYEQLKKDKK